MGRVRGTLINKYFEVKTRGAAAELKILAPFGRCCAINL